MRKQFLYFSVLLFIISCQPDKDSLIEPENPATKKCRLVKMIQGNHNGTGTDTIFTFSYDASGKITKVNFQNAAYNSNYDNILSYDDSGRLVKVSYILSSYFKYTSTGLLQEMSYNTYDSFRLRYIYGTSAIPEKCISYHYTYFSPKWDSTEHRYTSQNGNITSVEVFKAGVSQSKTNYEYDTIPNFNSTLALISQWALVPIGLYEEVIPFNKNVLKKMTVAAGINPGAGYYINYKTDSGRIVQSTLSWFKNTDTTGRDQRYYYYECQ